MNTEEIKRLKEFYQPGIRIRLISMEREPQMPEGLTGEVTGVDDAGQIHVRWSNGSSLALICDVDKFIAFSGPTTGDYLREKYPADTKLWFREVIPGCTRAVEIGLERLVTEADAYFERITNITSELALLTCMPYQITSIIDAFLSDHILSAEQVREIRAKYEFSKGESSAGICPKCGSDALEYGSLKLEDTFVMYPWVCKACGSVGKEYGEIVFDGHEVTDSPDFEDRGGSQ